MLSYVFTNNIPIKEPTTIFSSVNPHSESLYAGGYHDDQNGLGVIFKGENPLRP